MYSDHLTGERLVALSDDKHVRDACHELLASGISNVYHLEVTLVLLPVDNSAHTATIRSSSAHDHVTNLELNEVLDLSGLEVEHDSVVDLQIKPRQGYQSTTDTCGIPQSTHRSCKRKRKEISYISNKGACKRDINTGSVY